MRTKLNSRKRYMKFEGSQEEKFGVALESPPTKTGTEKMGKLPILKKVQAL